MANDKKSLIPQIAILKRDDLPKGTTYLIRYISYAITFTVAMIICTLVVNDNYYNLVGYLVQGAFADIWKLLLNTSLLLAFGIAIVPTFKMKYWNMGANGQVLVGTLVAIVIMFYTENFAKVSAFNNILVILLMLVGSTIASVIWAVIPSIFKVFFNTNETLFTLMMNYIAGGLVAYVNFVLAQGKKESPGIVNQTSKSGWLPKVFDTNYFIPILIITLMTVFVFFYMKKTKQGYEISVVGDSINTAKYVGMNTKKIIIRTIIVSGIICGIIGFLYASAINQSIDKNTCGSLGFTAILVAWLANFNPIIMAGISFVLAFLTLGTSKVSSIYRLGNNDLSNVIIGLIFFAILISEFFIRFKLKFNEQNQLYIKVMKIKNKLLGKKHNGKEGVEEC